MTTSPAVTTAGSRNPKTNTAGSVYARDGDEVVAATRMTWGGDGFSDRQVDQYQLAPFLAELPPDVMGVGERNTVLPAHRGTGVLDQLLSYSSTVTNVQDLRLVFGCCEPHLLSLYLKMGQRTYAPAQHQQPVGGIPHPARLVRPRRRVVARAGIDHPTR